MDGLRAAILAVLHEEVAGCIGSDDPGYVALVCRQAAEKIERAVEGVFAKAMLNAIAVKP